MRVFAACTHCSNRLSLRTRTRDRVRLAMKHGEEISLHCPHCLHQASIHVNDFVAQRRKIFHPSLFILVFLLTLMAIVMVEQHLLLKGYFYVSVGLFSAPIVAFSMALHQEQQRVNLFNRHRL